MNRILALHKLSIRARSAMALHAFERFCAKYLVQHEEIDKFLDYLWEAPLLDYTTFREWHDSPPHLVDVVYRPRPLSADVLEKLKAQGLSARDYRPEFNAEVQEVLRVHGIPEAIFRNLAYNVVGVIADNFYFGGHTELTMKPLLKVLKLCREEGIEVPPCAAFPNSYFETGDGWGRKLSRAERDAWRSLSTISS